MSDKMSDITRKINVTFQFGTVKNVFASRMFSKDTELYHKQLFEIGKKGQL